MAKIVANGVTYHMSMSSSTVEDIDIKPGVESVTFGGAIFNFKYISVRLRKIQKTFPDVKQIVLQDGIYGFDVSNKMFPNVREVISYDKGYDSGKILALRRGHVLLNTFCLRQDETLDMKGIKRIADYAFEGCMTEKIINAGDIESCSCKAFDGYMPIHDCSMIACIASVKSTEEFRLPKGAFLMYGIEKNIHIHKLYVDRRFFELFAASGMENNMICDIMVIGNDDIIEPSDIIYHKFIQACCFEVEDGNPYYISINGILYTKDKKTLMKCPKMKAGSVIIPEGVEEIAHNAFLRCDIESVSFPESLKSVGSNAFAECKNLKYIDFGSGICELNGQECFSECSSLTSVKMPEQLINIGDYVFNRCINLKDIKLNNGLLNIGSRAFSNCNMLDYVELPESLMKIGEAAFQGIKNIRVHGRFPEGFLLSIFLRLNTYDDDDVDASVTAQVYTDNGDFILPLYFDNACISEVNTHLRYTQYDMSYVNQFYKYAVNVKSAQDIAVKIYDKTHDPDVKTYLKRSSSNIAKRYIKEGKEEDAIRFLKLGLLTKKSLENLLDISKKTGMTSVSAYILENLKDKSDSMKSFSL